MSEIDKKAHQAFLDSFYGWAGPIYDLTRRYYLVGREAALDALDREPWNRLVEIGPGTGRNLEKLHRKRPYAQLGGVEPSRAMLDRARRRCPYATLVEGFAEDAEYGSLLDQRPDRVLFSYTLSMVQDPMAALMNARRQVAPDGEVLVVDFGDLGQILEPFRTGLRRWLKSFHVEPIQPGLLEEAGPRLSFGWGRYWVMGRLPAAADATGSS